jgi:hypothetical protein
MIDVSDSMFIRTGDAVGGKLIRHGNQQSFQLVRDEAIRLVNSLTSATHFDIIRWAGSARAWRPALVLATDENKTAAIAQIENESITKARSRKGGPAGLDTITRSSSLFRSGRRRFTCSRTATRPRRFLITA